MNKRTRLQLSFLFLLVVFGPAVQAVHGQEPIEVEAVEENVTSLVRAIKWVFGYEVEPVRVEPPRGLSNPVLDRSAPIQSESTFGGRDSFWRPYTPRFPSTLDDNNPLDIYLSRRRGTGIDPARIGSTSVLSEPLMLPSAEEQLTRPQIKRFQRMLNNFGYNAGMPNGAIGGKTRRALSELQKDNRLFLERGFSMFATSGELDERTQNLLNYLNDLTVVAGGLLKLSPAARDSVVDRSTVLRGYAETSDGIDLYLNPRADDETRDFLRHFGPSDFEIIRLHVSGKRKQFEFLNRPEAAAAFDAYCASFLKSYSTPEMRLVTARRNETVVNGRRVFTYQVLTLGGAFDLSPADLRKLRRGQPLPDAHPLSWEIRNAKGALVLWSHPLMKGTHGELNPVEDLAFNIQQSYPATRVYRDDFQPGVTDKKTAALTSFQIDGPQDLTVVLDDTSTITHWSIMEDIREHLEAAHVRVVDYKPGITWVGERGKAVIVITGHVDRAFYTLARQLIKDGYFKDNYVLFNGCSGPLSTKLVALINQQGSALATFHFQGRINRPEVQSLMLNLVEKVDSQQPFTLPELSPRNLKSPLKGIWVLCRKMGGGGHDDRG